MSFAAAVGAAGLSIAAPVQADTKGITPLTVEFGKRNNGRAANATEADANGVVQAGSNGRNRGGASDVAPEAQDVEGPVKLAYAREKATTRVTGSNGRGRDRVRLAEELPVFETVELTPEALETAAPDTVEGKLAQYRAAREVLFQAVARQESAFSAYMALRGYDERMKTTQFPDGSYASALQTAQAAFLAARAAVTEKQAATHQLLLDISDGKALSDDTIRKLNRFLGV